MQDTQKDETYLVSTVTEDEDDEDNSNTNKDTIAAAEETAQQDKLRIAAEKRRQKILQQANTRMSIVEGTYSATTTTTTETEVIAANDNDVETVTEKNATNKVADGVETPTAVDTSTTTTTTESASASATTSSKLAAMRRRRFQKKTTTTPASAPEPPEQTEKSDPISISTDNSEAIQPIKNDGTEVVAEVVITTAVAVATVDQVTEQTVKVVHENSDENAAPSTTTTAGKKYLGVAKMRRRMNKERQEQQLVEDDGHYQNLDDPCVTHAASTIKKSDTIHLPKKQRSMIATLPILMYAVTTIVLFVTGLHIGLQQTRINYCYSNAAAGVVDHVNTDSGYCYNTANTQQWSLMVHSELAPRKMGGLQRLLSTMNIVIPVVKDDAPVVLSEQLNTDFDAAITTGRLLNEENNDDTEDEFATTTESIKRVVGKGNIDPLFQVDLDAFTAGDGLYFTLGRFAVRVHRTILTVLYYTPLSILRSILSFIWSFVQTPPILFMMALFIRHGMGRVILGAKLPSTVADETQHKDIVSTVKTFVTKFLLSSFPTITIFYDVWTYIRSDMYVLLCGLFVGLALSHHHQAGSPYGEAGTTVTTTLTDMSDTIMDGISDEL